MTPQGGLTLNDVRQAVDEIRKDDDPEEQHVAEDALYIAVLRDIAELSDDSYGAAMAREALKVRDISFSRWYA